MSEHASANIHVAHHLVEQRSVSESSAHEALEIIAAIVIAIVAIATAWSGYEAALWTGHQTELYGVANKLRVQAEGIATIADQERLYNASTVVEWLKAKANGQERLVDILERRILPEFRPAFEAWKKTDPLNNPRAPAGPFFMNGYRSAKSEEAARLNVQAAETFEQGNGAARHSNEYVQVTVALATVLLLIALTQRFKAHRIRIGLAVLAALLLCLPLYRILTLPRA